MFPDIKEGREKMREKKNSQKEYFAFGSDDLTATKPRIDKTFDDHVKSGKEVMQKFGSFFSTSIQKLVKPKSSNETTEVNANTQKEPKKNETLTNLKQFSSKIGQGFVTFGVHS